MSAAMKVEVDAPEAESTDGQAPDPEAYSVYDDYQKRWISSAVCFSAMFSGLSSFIYYPALSALSEDLTVSIELINLSVTVYLIVSGLAPSILGDLADQIGRRPVSLIAFTLYLVANIGLALQTNYAALMVLRCVQSAGASSTIALAYGVIADITTPADRGGYVGILMGFTNAAPSLGPVLGGVLTQYLSWRWIFWVLAITGGVHLLAMFLWLPETSRRLTGNGSLHPHRVMNVPVLPALRPMQSRFSQAKRGDHVPLSFPNPLTCLVTMFQKATFLLLVVGGVTYTVYGCLGTSLSTQMIRKYELNYLTGGLVYLPAGVGGLLAAYTTGRILDRDYRIVAKKLNMPVDRKSIRANDLVEYPIEKARMRSAFVLLVISPISTIGFGWSLQARAHIAVPLGIQFFSGSSQVALFTVVGTLLTDLNAEKSATVQASYNLVRCGLSAAGIAALQPGIDGIGIGLMFTVYGVLALCCLPLCAWVRQSGWNWRRTEHVEGVQELESDRVKA